MANSGYSYIGRWPCGCVVAVVHDEKDKFTAEAVADFIKSGLTVERVTDQYVRENFIDGNDCPHRSKQLTLDMPVKE